MCVRAPKERETDCEREAVRYEWLEKAKTKWHQQPRSCDGEAPVQRPSTHGLRQRPKSDYSAVQNDLKMISETRVRSERREQKLSKGAPFFVACVFGGKRCQDMCKSDGAGILVV